MWLRVEDLKDKTARKLVGTFGKAPLKRNKLKKWSEKILSGMHAGKTAQPKWFSALLSLARTLPLVASFITLPELAGNSPFAGHLCVDKLRLQALREMKEAVSTSHCSHSNTIEHEMGIEWLLLQSRSDSWWNRLYKQQNEDLRKTVSELKRK
ncbi:hypothetical protein CQW23_34454 [Capsicum baccatum]|uniref:Uncharacterized protein n=1 Tax=Capsicum baccatum TaxID=33114 RepID=A0A2G2UZ21_CAPBA|nr:hypothetical protein CQW23_34454 [Capsicum baccatum]